MITEHIFIYLQFTIAIPHIAAVSVLAEVKVSISKSSHTCEMGLHSEPAKLEFSP